MTERVETQALPSSAADDGKQHEAPKTRVREIWQLTRARGRAARAVGRRFVASLLAVKHARLVITLTAHAFTLGITAYVFLILNKPFYANHIAYDESFFTWGGWCIRKGLVMYRDFVEFKPPMVFITHAVAQGLFGFENYGYRTFFTLFPLLSVVLLQASLVARGVERFFALASVLGIVALFVNPAWHDTALSDCESIGLSYYLLGLALFLWEGRFVKVTTLLGGVFMSACVFSKEPFAPVVAFTWLGLFWLRGRPNPSRASTVLFARYSLLGVGTFALLLSAYMVPTGAMAAYIEMAKGYSAIYTDPKRSYCAALGLNPTPLEAWLKVRGTFFNENVLGYLAPLAIPGAVFAFRRSKALFACMLLAGAGALWAATATKCMWIHYYVMSMAGVVFVLVAGVDSMKDALRRGDRTLRVGFSVAALLLIGLHLWPDFEKQRLAQYERKPWREPAPGLMALIAQYTTPEDRIFTSGPPILYVQADRISAVRETNIIDEILGSYEGDTDAEKLAHVRRQLVKNKPKVVFLDPEYVWRKGRHYRALMFPFLAEFKYEKVAENIYLRP